MAPSSRLLGVLIGTIILFGGCSPDEQSFSSAQLCVRDARGVAELKRVMRALAAADHLQFIDGSADAARALQGIGADKLLRRDPALSVDLDIEGARGPGVTASNLGLPPYEVALGFTQGSDPGKARRLSEQLVRALSQRWQVEPIAPGQGAKPMPRCGR